MNTIVFPVQVVGEIAAGVYVRADEAREEISRIKTVSDVTDYHCVFSANGDA